MNDRRGCVRNLTNCEGEKNRTSTGLEPRTSAIPVQLSNQPSYETTTGRTGNKGDHALMSHWGLHNVTVYTVEQIQFTNECLFTFTSMFV